MRGAGRDRKLTDKTNRLSYMYGVLVNVRGRRFFDEGEDFQFYTYAKLGGIILNEPSGVAHQIFDSKVTDLLEGRYKTGTPVVADTLRQLVDQLPVDRATCLETLEQYNAAVEDGWVVTSTATDTTSGSTSEFSACIAVQRGTLLGDLNCDNLVDFNDIDPFVLALISRSDYETQHSGCNWLNGDINADGGVNFNDIDGFVECLINGGCP